MAKPILTAVERFMRFIEPEPNTGCWLWVGPLSDTGYGSFHMDGGNMGAHRAAMLLLVGPIQSGLAVLHRCDQRHCCNPDHLVLGTIEENNSDMARKARGRRSSVGLSRGVREKFGKFCASVCVGKRKRIHLGMFATADEAANAVGEAYKLHYNAHEGNGEGRG